MEALDAAHAIGPPARQRLAGFVRTLRDNGFTVGLAETRDALPLLASPAAGTMARLRPALRALFCADRADWKKFDELFAAWWGGEHMRRVRVTTTGNANSRRRADRSTPPDFGAGKPTRTERRESEGDAAGQGTGRREGASRAETLSSTDLRHIVDPEDIAATNALAARLAQRMRARIVRRTQARRRGPRLDLRRTIHKSIAHGGTPMELVRRRRKERPVRLVMLLDASGSMSLYTAFFVRFLHGAIDAFGEAEAFVFHTRLAHVSASLRDRNVERAVDRLSLMAEGIGGGTKIGESLATFNRWYAKRVINSRTVVVIVSDGYDTGEPEVLAAEMQRLRRRARRIVWLNPLLGWKDYAPEAGAKKSTWGSAAFIARASGA